MHFVFVNLFSQNSRASFVKSDRGALHTLCTRLSLHPFPVNRFGLFLCGLQEHTVHTDVLRKAGYVFGTSWLFLRRPSQGLFKQPGIAHVEQAMGEGDIYMDLKVSLALAARRTPL